jgi:flagellar biosynthesis/type III secretory pathway protein FliH
MELANEASFTDLELTAYRKVMDEIQQAREYGAAKWDEGHKSGLAEGHKSGLAEGHKSGLAEGLAEGKRAALLRLLARRGIAVTEEEQRKISLCDDPARLDQWFDDALTASTAAEVLA